VTVHCVSLFASIIRQFQVQYHWYQFTSWKSNIRCCRTTPLEQSSYTRPSTWCVLGHFWPQTEHVFNCSRHQRLVTVVFRRCVHILLLTYLLQCRFIISLRCNCCQVDRSQRDRLSHGFSAGETIRTTSVHCLFVDSLFVVLIVIYSCTRMQCHVHIARSD